MKYIYFISLLILASAMLSSAQLDGSGLSDNCKNALESLIGNKDVNACFPFLSVAPVILSNNTSPDPATLSKVADSICGLPKCSDSLVTTTTASVKTGCQSDLASNNTSAEFVYYVLLLYSPTRDSICFKNSTGGYCFIESLQNINQVYQPGQDPISAFTNAPPTTVCTPCNKAISNTYLNYQQSNPGNFADIKEISSNDIDTFKRALSGKCGQNFLDGQTGDTTASVTADLPKKNSAISLVVNRLGFVALVGGSILAIL